jgi:glycosyltransferase involved in cell wall biosynthesis
MSTHPPTECGLATFNSSLAEHLSRSTGAKVGVVQVTSGDDVPSSSPIVVHTWPGAAKDGWEGAVAALNSHDVAIVQHEYGIYPGPDGEDVLKVLSHLSVPSVVILHTVLAVPSARQKWVLEQVASHAGSVVTMTETARDRLILGYEVDAAKISVIPHGANDHRQGARQGRTLRPHLLTWGLIGPGKGLEWSLRAIARLRTMERMPRYTIAGKTHPKVLLEQGESYRDSLKHLVDLLGLESHVSFDPLYRDNASLSKLIRSADVVILPYDSTEQVTSGVLIEAMAARVPVVATAFPHAIEVLTDGPGLVVPHHDPAAMAAAIRRILTEPGLADQLTQRAGETATAPPWPVVAQRYAALANRLVARRVPAAAAP